MTILTVDESSTINIMSYFMVNIYLSALNLARGCFRHVLTNGKKEVFQ